MKNILLIIVFIFVSNDILAQYLTIETKQRRRYDEIHLEIWIKSNNSNSPYISSGNFLIKYDTNSLKAINSIAYSTDSISANIDQSNPIVDIISPINSNNGLTFPKISTIDSLNGAIGIVFTKSNQLSQGIKVSNDGLGTFVALIKFKIKDSVNYNSFTGLDWISDSTKVYDDNSKDISEFLSLKSNPTMKVIGVTILSPTINNSVIDRDKNYLSLTGSYAAKGYPIYFERSVIPSKFVIPTIQQPQIDKNLGYSLEIRSGDSDWIDFGRFVETDAQSSTTFNNKLYYTGNINNPNTTTSYVITTQKGSKLSVDNFRQPVRILINKELSYKIRYDKLYLRLMQLEGSFGTNLDIWQNNDTISSNIVGPMSVGRIFFLKLNGINEYIKTDNNISNSTQLTVEAWVNINQIKPVGSNPGIIVSSAGEDATPINGSKEGSWMLYLKDGKYPAFKVREIEGRGKNGYLADLAADFPITESPIDSMYQHSFDLNWNHIAATVKNNEVILYVNGIIVDKFVNDSAIDTRMLVTNHPVWIGLNPNNKIETKNFLSAGIKAVRLWKVALSQSEIKKYANGLAEPANTSQFDDIRRGLILNYSFNGEMNDLANDEKYQQGSQNISLYKSSDKKLFGILYMPDFPHLKITSPIRSAGLSNISKSRYKLNWVAYEIGNISKSNSKDFELEYSLDGGISWTGIKDTLNKYQVGNNAPDIEQLSVIWEPYLNNDQNANIRTISPYIKKVLLRASGTVANLQKEAFYISDTITIAPYFAIFKEKNTIIKTEAQNTINFDNNRNMLELWIKPYRFPSIADVSMPLIAKVDSLTGKEYFSLKLLYNGLLEFDILDSRDSLRKAISNYNYPLIEANSIAVDTPWTHISVYFNFNKGDGKSFIRFYIDGLPQNDSIIVNQLGKAFEPYNAPSVATYFCSYPKVANINIGQYYGELRDFRYWNDLPANVEYNNDTDDLTLFVQGALSNRTSKFKDVIKKNLRYALSFNGGTGVFNEIRIFNSDDFSDFFVKYSNEAKYIPTKPYIKLVEPIFKQRVNNKNENLKIRWVGFDYSSLTSDIPLGTPSNPPIIEYSLLGGGGNETQPYKYVGSPYWVGNTITSLSIPYSNSFKFYGVNDSVVFAANLNVSQANPDKNNDGKYNDQGSIPATLTNARFRLSLKYRIFGDFGTINSEGQLFTITPSSNFTLRVIPEGYYQGINYLLRQIGNSYDSGGIKIKIFDDNKGRVGRLIDSAESFLQYSELDQSNLNAGNNKFANIDFVFENLVKNSYWVEVEKKNYLPILSRYAAPYIFEGDNPDTWQIESGWDFTSWNGISNNFLPDAKTNPWSNGYFTAFGNASSNENDTLRYSTSLVYSNGPFNDIGRGLSLMVAGDVNQDYNIDKNDYILLRSSEGTYHSPYDLTGDNYVNADDRVLVSKNMKRRIAFDSSIVPPSINNYQREQSINKHNDNINLLSSNSSVKLSFDYKIQGNSLIVDISMESVGNPFYLGSSTIAISYDTNVVKYKAFTTLPDVPFNQVKNGYISMRSAPLPNTDFAFRNVRTIEIEYDKDLGQNGALLENKKTYLGSFRFDILNNKSIIMKWHSSTTIHSIEEKIKPEKILRDSINPIYQYSLNLITPNGGEEYRPNTPIDIKWNFVGSSLINLEYSYNFGFTWNRINSSPINVSDGKYNWKAPSVYSTNYLVRVLDNESGEQVEISDSTFAIVSGFAYFLKPAKNDEVYMGGTKSQIYWASGGLSSITLLFSSNSGDKWTVISNKVDATKKEIMWTIPKINTKTAIIRMVVNLTKDTIVDTDIFKIMAGKIIFQKPKALEKVYINKDYSIRWSNDGVDTLDLQISYDDGNNWEFLKVNVPANNLSYKWLIPNRQTNQAIVRAIWKGDTSLEFGRSDIFIITMLNSISTLELTDLGISIFPNPTKDYLKFNNLSNISFDSYRIIDINGKEKLKGSINSIQEKIDLTELTSGIYILELKEKNVNTNLSIKIIKE